MTNQDHKNTQTDNSNTPDHQKGQSAPNKEGHKQQNQGGEKHDQAAQQGGGTSPQNQK